MNPAVVILKKRNGEALAPSEIEQFMRAYADGSVPEYQMSAFLMAVYYRGMNTEELAALVHVLLHSGATIDLSHIPGVKVDKHSTGGVGDKVSIVLAPLVAALGVPVPMMSGRGLGHSGGTADKLESIPGFRVELSMAEFRSQVEQVGCALITQSPEVAPLDRRLYALRDVTATVESIPLIASSIMSKKLAEGMDALLLDVKTGNGAFMTRREDAERLARTMISIGSAHGKRVVALITAMDRPLGYAVGNALEVEECLLTLQGEGPADLRELTLRQAAEMLLLADRTASIEEGEQLAAAALADGRALGKFRQVVAAQGGNPAVVDDPGLLPQANVQRVLEAHESGFIGEMDVRAIGLAAVELGAGRRTLESAIDPAVGFYVTAKPAVAVARGQPIATVHASTAAAAEQAIAALRAAIPIVPEAVLPLPLVADRLTSDSA